MRGNVFKVVSATWNYAIRAFNVISSCIFFGCYLCCVLIPSAICTRCTKPNAISIMYWSHISVVKTGTKYSKYISLVTGSSLNNLLLLSFFLLEWTHTTQTKHLACTSCEYTQHSLLMCLKPDLCLSCLMKKRICEWKEFFQISVIDVVFFMSVRNVTLSQFLGKDLPFLEI